MITATLDNRQGISCIIGDIGMGKSSLLHYLHAEYLSREVAAAAGGDGGLPDGWGLPRYGLRRFYVLLSQRPSGYLGAAESCHYEDQNMAGPGQEGTPLGVKNIIPA